MTYKMLFMIFTLAASSATAQEVLPLIDTTNPTPGITPPKVLPDSITPRYPPIAIRCSAEGIVGLELSVLTSGVVTDVRITNSSGYGVLDDAALEEVRASRYMPALENGQPLAVRISTKIMWKLAGEPHTVLETCLKALRAGEPPPS